MDTVSSEYLTVTVMESALASYVADLNSTLLSASASCAQSPASSMCVMAMAPSAYVYASSAQSSAITPPSLISSESAPAMMVASMVSPRTVLLPEYEPDGAASPKAAEKATRVSAVGAMPNASAATPRVGHAALMSIPVHDRQASPGYG